MKRNTLLSILFLQIALLLIITSCRLTDAVVPVSSSTESSNVPLVVEESVAANTSIDTDAIVNEVVATVTAQLQAAVVPAAQPMAETGVAPPLLDSDLESTLIELYQRVNPAVVSIFVLDSANDLEGSGSGFVIDEAGHIVTNNHVVAGGSGYEVVFADGERQSAELIGTDIDSDLAVIKIESVPSDVTPIALGDSNSVAPGQFVVAIGNPFGEAGSMSVGIISGLGRSLSSQRIAEGGGRYSLPRVIQTDAAINPGNSGGPLLNLVGEVVGVNSAIRTTTGTNSGVGFSIPVNAVHRIVPALIAEGSYTYPFMGIRMTSLDLTTQERLGLPQAAGAYVTDVNAGTPAEGAALVASGITEIGEPLPGGDLIIAVDGQPITSPDDLISYLVFETEVGQTIDLTVIRDGEEMIIPLTLGERP